MEKMTRKKGEMKSICANLTSAPEMREMGSLDVITVIAFLGESGVKTKTFPNVR